MARRDETPEIEVKREVPVIQLNDRQLRTEDKIGLWISRVMATILLLGGIAIVGTCAWDMIRGG